MDQKTKKSAFVKIVEQPASKGLRFRYECEGRSAGSIPGVSSSQDNKTFPTIQVVGYSGKAVVVVSCVTTEQPYRPHPHNLVGKEGCKKGVCTIHMNEDMSASFPNLGIQCVKKKDIDDSLSLRQQIRVDPFQTGFSHKTSPQNIDLNCVRLAFQVFLEGNEKGAFTFALKPVVSDPIYDRKAKCDLTICRLTETSGPVAGGKEILLFCDKINKDDVQVRFYQETNGQLAWEGFGDFQPSDVHKQYGICFRTPRYKNIEIEAPVQVNIQLRRPSDGAVSESRGFEFIPLDAGRAYWSAKRLKTNYSVFNQLVTREQAREAASKPGDQAQPQSELKHKVPLSRAPVMAGIFTSDGSLETSGAGGAGGLYDGAPPGSPQLGQVRQTLKPVAMPGGVQPPPLPPPPAQPQQSQQSQQSPAIQSASHLNFPAHSENISSQLPGAVVPLVPARSAAVRPASDLSIMSDFSSLASIQPDNVSINTRQSVNEILSMADISVYSGELDNLSVNTLLQSPLGLTRDVKEEAQDTLGSLTSVATVKEVRPAGTKDSPPSQTFSPMDISEQNTNTMEGLDLDIGQIYDDVMQCVYDDVDIKYDDVEILADQPPVPPLRKKDVSIEPADIDKPLPAAPRNNILTKLTEKRNELMTAREKELEKRKKEKEELEEQRRKEREEKERKKKEEKEAKRKEEEEKKAKLEEQKIKSSLFQRLFQRSQSRPAEEGETETETEADQEMVDVARLPPPPPPHQPSYLSQVSIDAQLNDLEQLIQCGELERLDSVVTEFTSQFPAESGKQEPGPGQSSPAVQT